MSQLQENLIEKFPRLLLFFLILQPVLDLATSLSIKYLNTSLTAGIVVRLLFMSISLIFIFFYPKSKLKRLLVASFGCLIFVISISFISAFFFKPIFHFFSEVQFYVKGLYFFVMFITYTLAFISLKKNHSDLLIMVLRPIAIAMTIAGLVFLISNITGTAFGTYRYVKSGSKGWFNSGNEIGAVLSICLPITLLFACKYAKSLKQFYYWIPAPLVIYSLILLGTKVGYLSIMISLSAAFAFLVLNLFIKKDSGLPKASIAIVGLMLVTLQIITPYTPAFSNTDIETMTINESGKPPLKTSDGDNSEDPDSSSDSGSGGGVSFYKRLAPLLSGRDVYLVNTHKDFLKSPTVQKILGMGYAGNYEKKPKLIEMDFFDLFYSYGFLGSVLFIFPILYFALFFVYKFKYLIDKMLKLEFILISCAIFLGLGISSFAGHVLFAPSVNIYLAVLLAYLYSYIEVLQ